VGKLLRKVKMCVARDGRIFSTKVRSVGCR